jgi:hypothetical protein
LETKKEGSNPYSTRILVKPSLVEYIKPGRGAPRKTTYNIDIESHNIQDRLDRLDIDERDTTPPTAAHCKHHCDHILSSTAGT